MTGDREDRGDPESPARAWVLDFDQALAAAVNLTARRARRAVLGWMAARLFALPARAAARLAGWMRMPRVAPTQGWRRRRG